MSIIDIKNTVVTVENAKEIIKEVNLQIEKLSEVYGFIPAKWKPIPVSHPYLYVKRAEAEKLLKKAQQINAIEKEKP